MTAPTVSINGTTKTALIILYSNAIHQIDLARGAISALWPSKQDFPTMYVQADAEHQSRLLRLVKLKDELTNILEQIRAQDAIR